MEMAFVFPSLSSYIYIYYHYVPPLIFLCCLFFILFRPTHIYIMLIFTLRRTELHIGAAGYKYLSTVLAQFQRRVFIRYHKGKHHLNGEHQGMEIPDNGGFIQKFYVVSRCNAAKTFHSFSVHIPFCFLQCIIILIIQKAGQRRKEKSLQL